MARICLAAPFRTERACSGVLGLASLRARGRGFDFIKLNRFALKHNMYWWLFSFPGFFIHTEIKNKRTANWNTDYCEPANKLSFSWRLFVVRTKRNKTKRVLADLADRACAVESAHSARVVSTLFVRACVRACVCSARLSSVFARACARACLLITNITIRVFLPIWEKNLVCWFDLNLNRYKKQKMNWLNNRVKIKTNDYDLCVFLLYSEFVRKK